jgi:hypothetical protein
MTSTPPIFSHGPKNVLEAALGVQNLLMFNRTILGK